MKPLQNYIAVVTGAGQPKGIGWATALKLASEGATVVAGDIESSKLDLLSSEIEHAGGKSLTMQVDVTERNQVEALVKRVCDTFGGIDILFNNAGTLIGIGPFLEISDHQWDLSYEVNLKGMVHFCQSVIPVMIHRGGGSIINNASLSGLGVIEEMAAYSATKFAVVGLTKSIASEFGGRNIRCNCVCPGMVQTDMGNAEVKYFSESQGTPYKEVEKQMIEPVALKRWANPKEVADAVAFLAGPGATYITGVALPVAGGLPAGL